MVIFQRQVHTSLHALLAIALQLLPSLAFGESVSPHDEQHSSGIWSRDNLIAWEIAPCDVRQRSPEQRAQMLEEMGFKYYAYIASTVPWNSKTDVNVSQHDADGEVEAMQRHGIRIAAWYLWINNDHPADDASVRSVLELFKRHNIHPDIWVAHSFAYYPRSAKEWARLMPEKYARLAWPNVSGCLDGFPKLQRDDALEATRAYTKAMTQLEAANYPTTPQATREKILREARRIAGLARLAAEYGCRVEIYNHHGWFGVVENELAIVNRLEQMGIRNVGIVYNFAHSRDSLHDDANDFPHLWQTMKSHVVAINVAGLSGVDDVVLPARGNRELAMMRTIQASGWQGPVGVIGALGPGDAEENLKDNLAGIRSIAQTLAHTDHRTTEK